MSEFLNIAGYKFAALDDLPFWREQLLLRAQELELRGTILLSGEGINLFVAGWSEKISSFLTEVRAMPGLADFTVKESLSAEQPFNRMLVKIKKEIIAFGVEGIDPARRPAPKVSAQELKQWLDEGRPITLLDTRNEYEVKLGTFRGALRVGIDHFRHFPAAVEKLSPDLKNQPVVTFCTGGIRCEKAAPFLESIGYQNIFQLDGGILKYFEECGAAHYDGDCFVFDRRVAVDPALQETEAVLCFVCQQPLTVREQTDPRYVPDISCPYCAAEPAREL
jgi:UPF0176 protein